MMRAVGVLLPTFMADRLASRFIEVARGIDLRVIGFDADGTCHGDTSDAEALFRYFPNDRFAGRAFGAPELRRVWERAPRLKWVQTNASGVDGLLFPELVESDVVLTSGASVNNVPVAESVVALLLAIAKRIPLHVRHQERREWVRYKKLELRGATVVVVGYGHIGEEVVRLCAALGTRVMVIRRNPPQGAQHAEAVFGPEELTAVLPAADFVVMAAAQNRGEPPIIGGSQLAAMKPTAWLINVARGTMVDEKALIESLRDEAIAGAALDVFENEPLPADNPLWGFPNVLITPHNSASSPKQDERTVDLFVENFRRWISGERLLNIVDKQRGY